MKTLQAACVVAIIALYSDLCSTQGLMLFRLHNLTGDYQTAVEECAASGGTLPVIDTEEIDNFLDKVLDTKSIESAWLLAKKKHTRWTWVKEEGIVQDQGCIRVTQSSSDRKYDINGPNPANSFANCLEICDYHQFKFSSIAWEPDRRTHVCKCHQAVEGRPSRMNWCPVECDQGLCGGQGGYERVIINTETIHVPWANDSLSWGDCGAVTITTDESGNTNLGFHSEHCRVWKHFLCTLPAGSASCAATDGKICLVPSGVESDWVGARQYCEREGGDLATMSILSEDLHHWTLPKREGSFWVGLAAQQWIWDTDEERPIEFTNWMPELYQGEEENCAVMKNGGRWSQTRCSYEHEVICQIHQLTVPPSRINYPTTVPYVPRSSVVPRRSSIGTVGTTEKIPEFVPVTTSKQNISIAVIAGACGGGVLLIIIIIVVAVVLIRRRKHKTLKEESEDDTIHSATNPMYEYQKQKNEENQEITGIKPCEYMPHVVDINVEHNTIKYKKDDGESTKDSRNIARSGHSTNA